MRTKTLLLAVAALATGIISSEAQSNVYSQNVVGYVNLSLTNGFNLIANPLDLDGTGTNNTVQSVFGTQLPSGSTVYAFIGGGYAGTNAVYNTKGGWSGDTNTANRAMQPGGGIFLKVPSATTVTIVGNVMQGSLSTHYNAGYNIISSQVPEAGLMQTTLGYTPNANDVVYAFNPLTQNYLATNSVYSTKGGWNIQPNLSIGQSVFLKSTPSGNWNTNFTVQ